MTYDNQKAIRRALRLARGGYAGGGAGMGGVATQGGPDGAAGATPKGFSPNSGEAPPPQVMGSPDAAGAPPKGFTPGATSYQPPPQPAPLPTGPSADFYQNLLSGMQFAQPTYRAYQPGDFAPQQLRQTYRFDPATDPSRIVNAELARQAAERAAQVSQAPAPSDYSYNYIDYGGGGDSGAGAGDGPGANANGGRIVRRRPFALGGQPTADDYEDQYGSNGALPVNFDGGNFGAPDPGAPTGAPGTGNFGTDLAGFGEAVGPALGGAAVGAALGGPAGAAAGMVGGTMAQGLAEALGLSAPATSPVGGLASVAGNIAQTQMGMTPTSNPMGAIADALTGPPNPADQEDADQGAAAAAAAAAAQAAAEADNTNSMSEASTSDAAGPGDDAGGPGGDGDFARGGVVGYADGGMLPRDLDADPAVQQALDVAAPFSVSNPMAVFPKPQRMWEDQRPGGAYLAMPTKEDITGHKAAQAEIGVNPGGKPFFNVSRDAVEQTGSPGRGSATVKTNLFKQKAGWQWAQAPDGHENTNTLVSITHRGKHHYALNAQFPKGVDLARYENAPSEPRLRPTTKGNVELGEQVGTIMVRGKEHPVYRNAIVRNAGGAVGYADGGMPGDDPTVQQALDITRQAQPTAPQMAASVQPQAMPAMQSSPIKTEDHPAWIPTRFVTSKKAVATPGQKDIVDLESMRQTPKLYQQNVDLVRAYPNTPLAMANVSHDDMAEHFIGHVKDNLLALHDAVPEEIRNRSKLWYDGARNIVDRWSKKYNLPDHSIAASLAALSPQKDWYQNVSLAERVLEAMRGQGGNFHRGFVFDDGMRNKFTNIAAFQKPEYQNLLGILDGKTLHDLGNMPVDDDTKAAAKALWIRLHDETYNDRAHKIVTPEGDFGDFVKTQKGENAGTGWGSLTEIGKAIRSIEAAENPALISSLMGEKHKVRNFYNNILAPRSPHGDVTIDTHAVAAGLYRPLSGNSLEVAHNFANYAGKGMPSAAGSALTGIQGTYPLYAEAYRRAAKERGILPREMQSITWEAVRGLFPDTFKTAANNKKIDAVWNRYKNAEISQQDARGLINEITGRIRNPSWVVQGGAGPNEIGQASNDTGNISGRSLRGSSAEGIERGGRGKPAASVSARARGPRPSPQIEEAASGGSIVDRALRVTSTRPMAALADLFQRQLRGK